MRVCWVFHRKTASIQIAILLAACSACGQGTFVYDQQTGNKSMPGETASPIQANEPIGQSFTPSLAGVGFIRLMLADGTFGNALGATIHLNLRAAPSLVRFWPRPIRS